MLALAIGSAMAALMAIAAALATRRRAVAVEARLATASRDLEAIQQAFSRFAPAAVVEDIVTQGFSTQSEKKEVTILFADVKGFTPLAERLDPAVLVRVLNGYFAGMSRAIERHSGHVSKFIGDGILAVFGALESNPWQANDAVHAALAMRSALADYNASLRAQELPALAIGIGIHRGTVVAGVIGSADLVEYGLIGAAVNTTARVEKLTRTHDVDILVTAAVQEVLDRRFQLRAMAAATLRGISEPVQTYAVDGFEAATPRPP